MINNDQMQIETLINENYITLTIEGEVDASCSIKLDEEFISAIQKGLKNILIDCSKMTYISSAGLGVFMAHIEECNAAEIKLVLYGVSAKINSVFDMLGLDQLLPIKNTEQEALNYMNE